MPKTEAPKTPEQNEKPQKPSPETRVKKNENSSDKLEKRLKKLGEKREKIEERTQKKFDIKTDKAYRGLADFSDDEIAYAREVRQKADIVRKERQNKKP